MPRQTPPEGFTTAGKAAEMLNVSDGMLSKYVADNKLRRYGSSTRKHKWYKLSEIYALIEARTIIEAPYTAGQWRSNPTTTFEPATAEDLPTIVDIDRRIFTEEEPVELEQYARWYRKNTESFFVLRDPQRVIKAYVCLLPVQRQSLDRYIKDEIGLDDLTEDVIDLWEPGKPLNIYVMAMGVDPVCSMTEKHEYGARMVHGIFSLFLNWAERGVEIESITARSYKPDGIKLMRKMGIPQLRSLTPGKNLFVVKVSESGFPLFVRYSDLLERWKQDQKQ